MRIKSGIIVAGVALTLLGGTMSYAQMPGGGPGGPGGGPGMGGPFAQFREQHKYTFQLMTMVRHIGEIDKQPKYALTPDHAKRTIAILKPLRSRPKLTQDQAKTTLKALKAVFTADQLNAMARVQDRRPGMGGGPGGPGGPGGRGPGMGGPGGPGGRGPGMGGPGGAGRPRMDPNAMKNFNPFYTSGGGSNPMAARMAQRWSEFFSKLEQRAKHKK